MIGSPHATPEATTFGTLDPVADGSAVALGAMDALGVTSAIDATGESLDDAAEATPDVGDATFDGEHAIKTTNIHARFIEHRGYTQR